MHRHPLLMNIDDHIKFFNPLDVVEKHRTNLPHWQQSGATYFVTFRLADALPATQLRDWKLDRNFWLEAHPKPWTEAEEREYHERFSSTIEHWLDAGHGSCLLRKPEHTRVIGNALAHFDHQRCVQHAWVVMPNHVHALFTLLAEHDLESLLHSWKSYTAKQIKPGGTLWQRDYFDRMIRSRDHFQNCVRYMRRNPSKAKLRAGDFLAYEAEWLSGVVT